MQPIRGTKDILPSDINIWQDIYNVAKTILDSYNYKEMRTPILEHTNLFERSIGNLTDIVNKEMYTFKDQGNRSITLRPEGTSSIARAVLNSKIHLNNKMNRIWYSGPMFRYERPQKGRQRQFHQLGIECIGSNNPAADTEVIKIANDFLEHLECQENFRLEINCIGNVQEREVYKKELIDYLSKYKNDLDEDSKNRIYKNPLRILDSKNEKTQEILKNGPILKNYLNSLSLQHFHDLCNNLKYLNINYTINNSLVRGLDYYNYTAFEIKTTENHHQNTICGGGRYDDLTTQLGGPKIPAVGWAIGLERLIILIQKKLKIEEINQTIYIATEHLHNNYLIWDVIHLLESYKLHFELDFTNQTINKKIKKANQIGVNICIVIGSEEVNNNYILVKWLRTSKQQKVRIQNVQEYFHYLKSIL